MSLKRHGKNNKPNALVDRHGLEYPTRDELISQLAQLRSSLDGAYETLDILGPSSDHEVVRKVTDLVEIINGLHECEFELMDLLANDVHVIMPTPSRGVGGSDNPVDNVDERLGDGSGVGDPDAHSHTASQEDLSSFGAYAVSSSRSQKSANELSKSDKADRADGMEAQMQIPLYERAEYIKRLEEIQGVNERLVDRCRRLGLVLRCGFALDKNFSSKMKEVKDIIAAKEQAQRKILELKALMQQVTEDKLLDTGISLAKIENDESYGRPYRFESTRVTSRGATSVSPDDAPALRRAATNDEENVVVKKPQSLFGIVDSVEPTAAPDYTQFLRGLHQPFSREHGERESAFVPIQSASHLDPSRDKNKRSSNLEGSDAHGDLKAHHSGGGNSLLRRVMNNAHSTSNSEQLDQQRFGRSSSARASVAPPHLGGTGVNNATPMVPNNLFVGIGAKSPPSMQSSSGIGSLDNCRNGVGYASSNLTRNHENDDNVGHRGFHEGSNTASNNLNVCRPFRQPTRSSSFYSELDFRNQEFASWDEDRLRSPPVRSPNPFSSRGGISLSESQQITDELNRVLRLRKLDESLANTHMPWWGSSMEFGHSDRHTLLPDHNYMSRGKSVLNDAKPSIGASSYPELDTTLRYEQFRMPTGQRNERSLTDCYNQILQLQINVQEIGQQIRSLTMSTSASKTMTRDALAQHRFDLHTTMRRIRDIPEMISESMKRIENQVGAQTRLFVDIESRLRRLEDCQRAANQHKYASSREPEWHVAGRPDFMVSQDIPFQFNGRNDPLRERDGGASGSMLNNQIPPGTRANNYWDNFRSYSRQNMLSKSNANVPQTFSHEASPSSTETSRYTSSDVLNNSNAQPVSVTSDGSSESRRGANGGSKNLWATSGFYENMSSKKRNKDQKSQGPAPLIKPGTNSLTNCNAPESLSGSHDSQPELDDSGLSVGRQPFHSLGAPQLSPYRRDSDSRFTLPWPPASYRSRPENFDQDLESPRLPRMTDTEPSGGHEILQPRATHYDLNNPNSQPTAPKIEMDKDLDNFEVRSSEGFVSLDDTRSSNAEFLDAQFGGMPDWVNERHNEVTNTLEGVATAANYRTPLSTPLLRTDHDGNEQNQPVENLRVLSSENLASSPCTVSMNIRYEENNTSSENSLSRGENRSVDANDSGNNNI